MGNEAGQWIMYGVDWDDPECIHTVEEAAIYINEVGFLPLFKKMCIRDRSITVCGTSRI